MKGIGTIITTILISLLLVGSVYAGVNIYSLGGIALCKKDVQINDFDGTYIYMTIKLWLKNPSSLTIPLTAYAFNISLNNIPCSVVANPSSEMLLAKQISPFTIPVKIDYKKTLGAVFSREILGYMAAKQYNKIVVGADGSVTGKVMGVSASKNLSFSESLQDIVDAYNSPSNEC